MSKIKTQKVVEAIQASYDQFAKGILPQS